MAPMSECVETTHLYSRFYIENYDAVRFQETTPGRVFAMVCTVTAGIAQEEACFEIRGCEGIDRDAAVRELREFEYYREYMDELHTVGGQMVGIAVSLHDSPDSCWHFSKHVRRKAFGPMKILSWSKKRGDIYLLSSPWIPKIGSKWGGLHASGEIYMDKIGSQAWQGLLSGPLVGTK